MRQRCYGCVCDGGKEVTQLIRGQRLSCKIKRGGRFGQEQKFCDGQKGRGSGAWGSLVSRRAAQIVGGVLQSYCDEVPRCIRAESPGCAQAPQESQHAAGEKHRAAVFADL